jgi:signal recognition particle GTPase
MAGGFFERLKAGLSRTAEAVANLLARPMDDQAAEELRERLILGDFGPATADEAVAAAKAAGAKRAMRLNVSGPFHTPVMRGAGEKVAEFLQANPLNDLEVGCMMNHSAKEPSAGTSRIET